MAYVDKEEEVTGEARDDTIAETDTATMTVNDSKTETETDALAANDLIHPAQRHMVL